ncbi:hypothetical protein ACJX0J_016312, partial [Zea mays]
KSSVHKKVKMRWVYHGEGDIDRELYPGCTEDADEFAISRKRRQDGEPIWKKEKFLQFVSNMKEDITNQASHAISILL